MEIDVTDFVEEYGPDYLMCSFADSVSATGLENIGETTWGNALSEAEGREPLTEEQVAELRDHFLAYGAWEESELQDPSVLHAMLLQEVAIEYREHYEELPEGEEPDFSCSGGRLVRCDVEGEDDFGKWFFCVGA